MDNETIENRLAIICAQPFRAKFHLGPTERAMVADKGLAVIRKHAQDLLSARLFPAFPANDGKQTPYRGHPVFVAQHATATCCRNCLMRWHHIPKGREVTLEEQKYILDVIEMWIEVMTEPLLEP